MIPQHSLPGGRYPLPGPDFHRLELRLAHTNSLSGSCSLEHEPSTVRSMTCSPPCIRPCQPPMSSPPHLVLQPELPHGFWCSPDHPRSARGCAAGPDLRRLIQLLVVRRLPNAQLALKADRTVRWDGDGQPDTGKNQRDLTSGSMVCLGREEPYETRVSRTVL